MRVVVQRVSRAKVTVERQVTGEIGPGLMVLLGVGKEDSADTAAAMAEKVVNLRIFEDEQGKMNRSLVDVKGGVAGGFAIYFIWRCAGTAAAEFSGSGTAGAS